MAVIHISRRMKMRVNSCPTKKRHSRNVVLMRRWPNIETALGERILFTGRVLGEVQPPTNHMMLNQC